MANIKRLIVMVLFEHVYLLDVTGPAEVFSLLQREMDEPTGYEVVLAAATLAPVMTSAGVRVLPDTTFADLAPRRIDTLVVPGAVEVTAEHLAGLAPIDDVRGSGAYRLEAVAEMIGRMLREAGHG